MPTFSFFSVNNSWTRETIIDTTILSRRTLTSALGVRENVLALHITGTFFLLRELARALTFEFFGILNHRRLIEFFESLASSTEESWESMVPHHTSYIIIMM